MNCPRCYSNKIKVINKRNRKIDIYRRRVCCECSFRFSTKEIFKEDYVEKTSEYDLEKLEMFERAIEKCPSLYGVVQALGEKRKVNDLTEEELQVLREWSRNK